MTIEEAQARIDAWIKEYGVRYFNEMTNLAILMEEVGEVARIMARRYGEQSEKESDKGKRLDDELACWAQAKRAQGLTVEMADTEHFLTARDEAAA